MDWITVANLILAVGLSAAERIWQKWATGQLPTQADWDELKAMAAQRAIDRAKAALERNGIALDSEQGKAILALIPVIV